MNVGELGSTRRRRKWEAKNGEGMRDIKRRDWVGGDWEMERESLEWDDSVSVRYRSSVHENWGKGKEGPIKGKIGERTKRSEVGVAGRRSEENKSGKWRQKEPGGFIQGGKEKRLQEPS